MSYQLDQGGEDLAHLKRILIVDDAADTRLALSLRLQREGYLVSAANSGEAALRSVVTEGLPHLIILDIMMPEMDGFSFADEVRQYGDFPIIFLSAVSDTQTKVDGINQFAEDYITKPFEFSELLARMQRVLARTQMTSSVDSEVKIDDRLWVNFSQQYVVADDQQIALTPIESRILRTLFVNRGRVISTAQLLSNAWDPLREGSVESLWVHIRRLRGKIEPDLANPIYITTIRGQGYCLPANQHR